MPIPPPRVVSGQRARRRIITSGKVPYNKVSHIRTSGAARVKDRVFGRRRVRVPVARIRSSLDRPSPDLSSTASDDESWASDGILPGTSTSPSANYDYVQRGASHCESGCFGGLCSRRG